MNAVVKKIPTEPTLVAGSQTHYVQIGWYDCLLFLLLCKAENGRFALGHSLAGHSGSHYRLVRARVRIGVWAKIRTRVRVRTKVVVRASVRVRVKGRVRVTQVSVRLY